MCTWLHPAQAFTFKALPHVRFFQLQDASSLVDAKLCGPGMDALLQQKMMASPVGGHAQYPSSFLLCA
jgi:hypothetical protein